jgi:uncharacterized protein (TIGR03435 family)
MAMTRLAVMFMWLAAAVAAQSPTFDVASIKRNLSETGPRSIRIEPSGRIVITGLPLSQQLHFAYPVVGGIQNIKGIPSWMNKQRYDLILQPPAGAAPEHVQAMWRNLFETRMKLAAHYETVEQQTFALVNGRKDGSVPSQLIRSTASCDTGDKSGDDQQPPQRLPNGSFPCGMTVGANSIVSGGTTMEQLAGSLRGAVDALVVDRTGLEGRFVFALTYSRASVSAPQSDLPSIFTAVQEQLGLKLEPQKSTVQILVVDYAEPPSDN